MQLWCRTHALRTTDCNPPRGPPSHQGIWAGMDPLNKLKMQLSDVSCQRGEFCLHQTQKKIMLRKASVTYISLCRKKIMLRAPSCSTWNCDADSSSGNCLAAWQDWQNPRRERIHLIRLPLISSSAFLITWKYALQISTKSQTLNMLLGMCMSAQKANMTKQKQNILFKGGDWNSKNS